MSKSNNIPQVVYKKMMEKDYFSQWLGIEPILIAEGHAKIKMVVREEMLNGLAILHGGVAFAFADSCFAFAANSYGRGAVTLNANITFSKSAKPGDTLIAEAIALNLSHKTADFDVNIYEQESGKVYYRFRGTAYRSNAEIGKDTIPRRKVR